jgi:hypothetical protein
MDKHDQDLAGSVAARERGLARVRTAAVSATVASMIAAGTLAFSLPGGTSATSTSTRTTQSGGSSGQTSTTSGSPASGGTSRKLSAPASAPAASSGTGQATSGGS